MESQGGLAGCIRTLDWQVRPMESSNDSPIGFQFRVPDR